MTDVAVRCRLIAQVDPKLSAEVDLRPLERAAELTLAAEGLRGDFEVSLTVCDDATMQRLNARHLGHDYPTDVLSFPLGERIGGGLSLPPSPDGVRRLGDIVVSYETARAQAAEYAHSTAAELTVLFVHGLLHLLGYDDQTDAERQAMQQRAAGVLSRLPDNVRGSGQ